MFTPSQKILAELRAQMNFPNILKRLKFNQTSLGKTSKEKPNCKTIREKSWMKPFIKFLKKTSLLLIWFIFFICVSFFNCLIIKLILSQVGRSAMCSPAVAPFLRKKRPQGSKENLWEVSLLLWDRKIDDIWNPFWKTGLVPLPNGTLFHGHRELCSLVFLKAAGKRRRQVLKLLGKVSSKPCG